MKIIFFALISAVFFAHCLLPFDDNTIKKAPVYGKVLEVILLDTNNRVWSINSGFHICFVVETQNLQLETLTLWKPERGEYSDGCFLHNAFYDEGKLVPLGAPDYRKTVVVPPLSSQIDTIPIFEFKMSNPKMSSQMFWVEKFKNGSTLLVYLPRPAPFYQDTIFYTFDKDVKYSSRLYEF